MEEYSYGSMLTLAAFMAVLILFGTLEIDPYLSTAAIVNMTIVFAIATFVLSIGTYWCLRDKSLGLTLPAVCIVVAGGMYVVSRTAGHYRFVMDEGMWFTSALTMTMMAMVVVSAGWKLALGRKGKRPERSSLPANSEPAAPVPGPKPDRVYHRSLRRGPEQRVGATVDHASSARQEEGLETASSTMSCQ